MREKTNPTLSLLSAEDRKLYEALLTSGKKWGVSPLAILLYLQMLDLASQMPRRNNPDRNVDFIIHFSDEEAANFLGISIKEAKAVFAELDSDTGIGFIERVPQFPGIYYVHGVEAC